MSQVMQTGVREHIYAGPFVVRPHDLAHECCHRVGIQRLAPARGEYETIGSSTPCVSETLLFGSLESLMSLEDGDGLIIDGYDPSAPAFGSAIDPLAANDRGRTGDGDALADERYVRPAEVQQFSTARPV
jgi:hypothetical protein